MHPLPLASADGPESRKRLARLSLAALGVVYGDIGTSPLYALRECFHGDFAIAPTAANLLGVLSLMFWSLILIVSVKYLTFILHADNRGEGGVIALTALVGHPWTSGVAARRGLILLGLFAASLLYGDGMITPAISVLSATEGLSILTPALTPYVVPATVAILLGLFLLQKRGTAGVGSLFGPMTLVWFSVLAILGLRSLVTNPGVLAALAPWHGLRFLAANGWHGVLVLGAVFLVVTGTEALYADLGHFGRRPIRLAWYGVVLPALLLNYFGQGALLLAHPDQSHHPFYALAPSWLLVPLVVLATVATIIASQAVISGAFSLTRQAIQLGYLPRLRVVHTSRTEIGQIYVPQVNWLLAVSTIALVLGFRASSRLAAAYGVAVTTTMLSTSILFYVVARKSWGWGRLRTGVLVALFVVVDLAFFTANISKVAHGAWLPLAIGAGAFIAITTWRTGRSLIARKLYERSPVIEDLASDPSLSTLARVPGKAVFLAGTSGLAPPALTQNLRHNKVLHADNAILTVVTADVPTVDRAEKVEVTDLGGSFYRVTARYGFMEDPSVPHVLAMAAEKGLPFGMGDDVSFFLGRERVMPDRRPMLPMWRERLFAFMSRNAVGATAFFKIPPEQVVEIGAQVEI